MGLGASASYEAPEKLLRQLDPTADTSRKRIFAFFGKSRMLNEALIGVLTNQRLDRTLVSKETVMCALVRFLNTGYYEGDSIP